MARLVTKMEKGVAKVATQNSMRTRQVKIQTDFCSKFMGYPYNSLITPSGSTLCQL